MKISRKNEVSNQLIIVATSFILLSCYYGNASKTGSTHTKIRFIVNYPDQRIHRPKSSPSALVWPKLL
jgi:hypothetical protein